MCDCLESTFALVIFPSTVHWAHSAIQCLMHSSCWWSSRAVHWSSGAMETLLEWSVVISGCTTSPSLSCIPSKFALQHNLLLNHDAFANGAVVDASGTVLEARGCSWVRGAIYPRFSIYFNSPSSRWHLPKHYIAIKVETLAQGKAFCFESCQWNFNSLWWSSAPHGAVGRLQILRLPLAKTSSCESSDETTLLGRAPTAAASGFLGASKLARLPVAPQPPCRQHLRY